MTRFAFFNGKIVPIEEAKVSVMTHALNYGTGCFGGIRGYWNRAHEQLYVFRMVDHYRRFLQSAKLLLMELDYSAEELVEITVDLLGREGWTQDCYIRPLAYKSTEGIGVRLHNLEDGLTIFSVPMGDYLPVDHGIRLGTSSWRRVDDTAIPARGKISGSYANSALIKTEAQFNGFDDALVLNQDGHVSEASAANFLMVRNGKLITTTISDNVLEGIVRSSVLQLAQEQLGLPVEERPIDRSEVYIADEAFLCGTGVQISPVISVDHRTIGNGEVGPVVTQIQKLFFDIVRGNDPAYGHWLTAVPQRELVMG
ncbi:MAG: branched-chain amino acid transaminase [Caldilineaceae bacterium]|nr:branched-chain amino acid transaminase [Caldilineaceae bacterium]